MKINCGITSRIENNLISDLMPKNPLAEVLNPQKVRYHIDAKNEFNILPISDLKDLQLNLSINTKAMELAEIPKSKFEFLYKFRPLKQRRQNEFTKTFNEIKQLLSVKGIEKSDYKVIIDNCRNKKGKIDTHKLSLVTRILKHPKISNDFRPEYVLDNFRHKNGKTYDKNALIRGLCLLEDNKISNENELCTPFHYIFEKNKNFEFKEYDAYRSIIFSNLVEDGKAANKLFSYCYTPEGYFIPKMAKFVKDANYNKMQFKFDNSKNMIDFLESCKGKRNAIDDELFEYATHFLKNPKIKKAENLQKPMHYLKRFINSGGSAIEATNEFDRLLNCEQIKTGEDFAKVLNECVSTKSTLLDMNLLKFATNSLEQRFVPNSVIKKSSKERLNRVDNFLNKDNNNIDYLIDKYKKNRHIESPTTIDEVNITKKNKVIINYPKMSSSLSTEDVIKMLKEMNGHSPKRHSKPTNFNHLTKN